MTSTTGEGTPAQSSIAEIIKQTADKMMDAAYRAGVDPDDGLGYWIIWQKNLAYGHADMYEAFETKIDEQKAFLDKTISNIKSAAEASKDAIDYRMRHLEGDVNRIMGESISAYGKLLAEDTSRWRYVREKKWNLKQNLMGVLGLTTLAACLVIGGYFWRMALDTDPMAGTWACKHGEFVMVNTPDGPFLSCPMDRLVDPGTMAAMNREFLPPKNESVLHSLGGAARQ